MNIMMIMGRAGHRIGKDSVYCDDVHLLGEILYNKCIIE